ncbi:alanine/ornithine racemase family PLP-dependent enzyme [Coriobacteriia bacterium Es71-Z0120]|uniref:alanine/ornithine racemase family PLP-dependent enzyme n=1 Tax=Parvivirga hydrogeniphila TaxID=2939460 RepID=UPI002260CCC8|nr:alanine/ornithine racemase family PLP-dependent enzyme [Parvivirga hydrogeniphila]MCL4078112.1 alanine/ornithine racemase family PLP-dependent enzyme [Parvivirga hydrogeniphila]
MVGRATVTVDLDAIRANAERVVAALGGRQVVGVTKVTCGDPDVARAMLDGGCTAIGDSRLENLERLREAGVRAPLWLLRSAVPAAADEVVRLADVSLESEVATLAALDAAARRASRRHAVVAMVDLGDLREGMMPGALPAFVEAARSLEAVDVVGIGTSLTCFGGVVPDSDNLGRLVELVRETEQMLGRRLMVSGGMSSSLDALIAGELPDRVDNLRIGESIILGVSTVTRTPVLGLRTDAITLEVPVIEVARKPSLPQGRIAQDAFGHTPAFSDRGERLRAICAIGRQDVVPEGLTPLDEGVEVLGASSDHLVCDAEEMRVPPRVGDALRFRPGYAAMLALFTSPYVEKVRKKPRETV